MCCYILQPCQEEKIKAKLFQEQAAYSAPAFSLNILRQKKRLGPNRRHRLEPEFGASVLTHTHALYTRGGGLFCISQFPNCDICARDFEIRTRPPAAHHIIQFSLPAAAAGAHGPKWERESQKAPYGVHLASGAAWEALPPAANVE